MTRLNNRTLALNLAAIVAGMAMLSYAAVPLYRLFCETTGYGGTPRQAAAVSGVVGERVITITFNADIAPGLAWRFTPGEKKHAVRVGEQALSYYIAENLANTPVTGHATYNVLPHKAGKYFSKIDCFCFTEQTLGPKQKVHMPVSFFIDPAIMDDPDMDDVKTITLSYTFFSVQK